MRRLSVDDDTQVAVTLSADGSISIHHSLDDQAAAHGAVRRLAAQTTNHAARVNLAGLAEIEPHIVVEPPGPGRAVLACGCGRVMDAGDMRYLPLRTGDATFVRPVVCARCAA